MHSKFTALTAAAILLALCIVPLISDDAESSSYYSCEGLTITSFEDTITVNAGEKKTVSMTFRDDSAGDVSVRLVYLKNPGDRVNMSFSTSDFTLVGGSGSGSIKQVAITFDSDNKTAHGTAAEYIKVYVYNYGTSASGEVTIPLTIDLRSSYSSDSSYNRIMGFIPNSLPAPFDTAICAALITGAIWAIIAAAAFGLVYIVTKKIFIHDDKERRDVLKKTGSLIVIAILITGLAESLKVAGCSEDIISLMSAVYEFIYIFIFAYIAWNVYMALVSTLFHTLERNDKIEDADSSLIPLFNMIGGIIIGVSTLAAILGVLGFNLAAILTGAGIVSVAISLGAQNTLSEFFSGLTLLITRPFRPGDMIKIGSGTDVYEVVKVGLMNSRFKNWANLEYVVMPNTAVSSSAITNITAKTQAYRIFLYFDVSYDAKTDDVRRVLISTAEKHPQVITDGSYSKPDVRVTAYNDSSVQYRLAVYITDFRDNVTVSDELYAEGYANIEKNGMEIPYDKYDIYLIRE